MSDHWEQRKLIEVALPLDEINAACKADKDRKTGTIRNVHKWFAPMPLPAWRALLFAALVDDPGNDEKRAYLLDVIKRLVAKGADLPNEAVVAEAREILQAQYPAGVPTVMDPFCGGGSTLVEAQRLGLPTFGSDLNPVPVLITRTLTELLPKVYGGQSINDQGPSRAGQTSGAPDRYFSEPMLEVESSQPAQAFTGYDGLKQDVRHYAEWVRQQVAAELDEYFRLRAGKPPLLGCGRVLLAAPTLRAASKHI